MKILKRIITVLFIFLLLLVGGVALIPFFFKDRISTLAKTEINKTVNAKVDFQDVSLNLFRNFPHLRLGLKEFNLEGVGEFAEIPLAKVASFDLVIDLFSVIAGKNTVNLKSIHLQKPEIQILVLENGTANYNIAKASEDSTPGPESGSADFTVNLKRYSIDNGLITYNDKSTNTFVKVMDLDHQGSGQFTLDVYDLSTRSEVSSLTVRQGGVTYLDEAYADLDATINIDQGNSKYTLRDNELRINDLIINASGYTQLLPEDRIELDLKVTTPQNNFKNVLSLVPNAYTEGYEDVDAAGKFNLSGLVRGTYDAVREKYPAFQFSIRVDNGNVRYPDLPLGISGIYADLFVDSPGSSLADLVIDAESLKLQVGKNPFAGSFKLSNIMVNPTVDGYLKGMLDLADLARAYPMDGVREMSGVIQTDMEFRTSMSAIEEEQYDEVIMQGEVVGREIIYESESYPKIAIRELNSTLSPRRLIIGKFQSELGKSDLAAEGAIDNLLAYFSPNATMRGNLKVKSAFFDANEWYQPSEASEQAVFAAQNAATELAEASEETTTKLFDRFDFSIEADFDEILFESYRLTENHVTGHITPNSLQVQRLSGRLKDTDYAAEGDIDNIFDYLFEDGILAGEIQLNSGYVNLNQFMVSAEGPAEAGTEDRGYSIEAILVPPDINMSIDANIGKVLYDKIEMSNISGNLLVRDRTVLLNDVQGKGLGGTILMSGTYDTQERNKPAFNIKYDMTNMDFQESFAALNTFQKLAPIGRFVNGNYTTSLIMEGQIGDNLLPDLGSLSAKGYLETINGIISGFRPLEIIGNTLDIQELKDSAPIAQTRNWFEIKEGRIELKEFDYLLEDIAMKIGGSHSITQEIDYQIKAAVPRAKLGNGVIGSTAGKGISLIQEQAGKLGIPVNNAEIINLGIRLTGNMTNPKIKVNLLGTEGETSLAQSAKEEVKEKVASKVEEQKDLLDEKKKEVLDSAQVAANEKLEEVKDEVTEKAGEVIKEKVGGVLGTAIDSTLGSTLSDTTGQNKVDDIRKELEKFNPFKKKKKKN